MPITAASVGLFLHIVASFWLAAGTFAGAVVRAQAKRTTGLAERVALLRTGARMVQIFILPGALVSGALGFWLVTARGWGFQLGWVHASMALYFLMLGAGLLYLGPRMRALVRAAEASLAAGAPTEEFRRLAANKLPGIIGDLNALGLILLVLLMTLKPF